MVAARFSFSPCRSATFPLYLSLSQYSLIVIKYLRFQSNSNHYNQFTNLFAVVSTSFRNQKHRPPSTAITTHPTQKQNIKACTTEEDEWNRTLRTQSTKLLRFHSTLTPPTKNSVASWAFYYSCGGWRWVVVFCCLFTRFVRYSCRLIAL